MHNGGAELMTYERMKMTDIPSFSNIYVFRYSPKVFRSYVQNRHASSLMYVIKGRYRYVSKNIDLILNDGEVIYLPRGAQYEYSIISENALCIQVTFDLKKQDGDTVTDIVFATGPTIVKQDKLFEYRYIFEKLLEDFQNDNVLSTHSNLFGLLSLVEKNRNEISHQDPIFYRIKPAVQYIKQNCTSHISIAELAKMCDMSESHFRKLFTKCMHCSPITYKNELVAEMACELIKHEKMNISEIAYSLQFTDIQTFSQFFKKIKGVSPKKYAMMCLK